MLSQLIINDFAIVKQLQLDLRQGMTTVTGETGAGKSIAIDALGLCLGDRAEASMVRPGAKKTDLSARFMVLDNPTAQSWLAEHDLDDDNECILRRTITAEGRSRAYINGTAVPLAQLKALGQHLISIHGQHAHQTLLKPQQQLHILDEYAAHHDELAHCRTRYRDWKKLSEELKQLQASAQAREARKQLLEYQVQELDEFGLKPGEFAEMEQEHKRLAASSALMTESQASIESLYESEHGSVASLLHQVCNRLQPLVDTDAQLQPIISLLQEAEIQVEEASHELRHYHDGLELDPARLELLDERISEALQLARKHMVDIEQLPEHHATLAQELSQISHDGARLDEIEDELAASVELYREAAEQLSQSRRKFAHELNQLISDSMHELSMSNGEFCIQFLEPEDDKLSMSPLGSDQIEFQVRTNPGQPLQAMQKVASGGELSRISLAIQVITAKKVSTPTLIFDEVDVGISGPTAAVVGRLLRMLGESTQVICITHLPQVAGNGHQQYFVAKHTDGETTETRMTELKRKDRLQELARLLAGDQITKTTLANAEELLVCA